MCEFFAKADPIQYEQRSRTVRMHGVLTSIRLENMVWNVLAEMAQAEGRTTNALISMFHEEMRAYRGAVPNFASFLRVTCLRYLAHKASAAEAKAQALVLVPIAETVETRLELRQANGVTGSASNIGSSGTSLPRPTLVPVSSRA